MPVRRSTLARPLVIVAAVAASCLSAIAQPPPAPSKVRGTVEAVDGDMLSVKSRDGEDFKLHVAGDTRVVGLIKISLTDIKVGSFIGTTTVPGPEGGQNAVEVHVFPENMRGTAEGQNPMGPDPARSMTNATVTAIETRSMTNATVSSVKNGPQGGILKLKYEGGEAEIEVGPDVPVIALVPADASLLKPGAAVIVFAFKTDKGQVARFMSVEKDGFKPVI
jgi:hypothetical protein